MPPTRTMPPAKAVKTERSHEENQERAYIAASRRSDRSLEARVESARRASEIHKQRTGRSLRVREEDVQNEEMYEEEDDGLPYQYRQLTAHLNTGSGEFNTKLSAYLSLHVNMRNMVEQAVNESYNQQYGMVRQPGPMHPHQHLQHAQPAQPFQPQQPLQAFQAQQSLAAYRPQQAQQGHLVQSRRPGMPAQTHSSSYRQAPYSRINPGSHAGQLRIQTGHSRSASITTPQELHGAFPNSPSPVTPSNSDRRMSLPATPGLHVGPQTPTSASRSTPHPRPSYSMDSFSQQQVAQQKQFAHSPTTSFSDGQNYGPFTSALPADTQMFFNNPPDFDFHSLNGMMPGNHNPRNNFSNFNFPSRPNNSKAQNHPNFNGLDATLAPSALDMNGQSSQTSYQGQGGGLSSPINFGEEYVKVEASDINIKAEYHDDDLNIGGNAGNAGTLFGNASMDEFLNWETVGSSQTSTQ